MSQPSNYKDAMNANIATTAVDYFGAINGVARFEFGGGQTRDNNNTGNKKTDFDRNEKDLDGDGLKGVDCSSLVWRALHESGYKVSEKFSRQDGFNTSSIFKDGVLTSKATENFDKVGLDELKPGDILLFNNPKHMAIFTGYSENGNIQFFGAQTSTGPAHVNFDTDFYWPGKVSMAIRPKEEFAKDETIEKFKAEFSKDVDAIQNTQNYENTQNSGFESIEQYAYLKNLDAKYNNFQTLENIITDKELKKMGEKQSNDFQTLEEKYSKRSTEDLEKLHIALSIASNPNYNRESVGALDEDTRMLVYGLRDSSEERKETFKEWQQEISIVLEARNQQEAINIDNQNRIQERVETNSEYIVKRGDTLTSIARELGVSMDDITKLNPGLEARMDNIYAGEKFIVPERVVEIGDFNIGPNRDFVVRENAENPNDLREAINANMAVATVAYFGRDENGNQRFEYGRGDKSFGNSQGNGKTDGSRLERDLDGDGLKGIDCSSMVWRALEQGGFDVQKEFGSQGSFTTLSLFSNYNGNFKLTDKANENFDQIKKGDELKPGDIMLFGNPRHVGVFTGYKQNGNIQFFSALVNQGPEFATFKEGSGSSWDTKFLGALRPNTEFAKSETVEEFKENMEQNSPKERKEEISLESLIQAELGINNKELLAMANFTDINKEIEKLSTNEQNKNELSSEVSFQQTMMCK